MPLEYPQPTCAGLRWPRRRMVLARPGCQLIGNYNSSASCLMSRALDTEQSSEYNFPREQEHVERRRIFAQKKTAGTQIPEPAPNSPTQPIRISHADTQLGYLTLISNYIWIGYAKWVYKVDVQIGCAKRCTSFKYLCTSHFFLCEYLSSREKGNFMHARCW